MTLTDAQLEALLDELESDRAERKESWTGSAPEKGRQAISAFANDLPDHRQPGVLFVGAKDNGTPSGIQITDQLLLTLADIKTDGKTVPPPTLVVERRTLKGAEMAIVTVQPADAPPVRYEGRVWIRLGPRRGIATAQDERILNERRRHRDLPFDIHPVPSCPMGELSQLQFESEYLPNAVAPDILAANERSHADRLIACRMAAPGEPMVPTWLGVMVLGRSSRDWLPGFYIQFLRIDGTDLTDPIMDEMPIDGPLGQMLRRLDDKLDSHGRTSVDLTSSATETRRTAYPLAALHQLARNAVMHRTYEATNAPVRIYWFNDRIEIHNPGGPFGIVTPENFGRPGITDYRNPHLAEAMKVLGFVQRFGVGISVAQKLLKQNGNPPAEFTVESNAILATVRAAA